MPRACWHMILAMKQEESTIFSAYNEVCHTDQKGAQINSAQVTIGEEYLAAHQCNSLPLQHLWIQKNAIMMVMRNIDLANGLANGTIHLRDMFIYFVGKVHVFEYYHGTILVYGLKY